MQPLDPLTLPLEGACLVEASAGSGKTYTITTLYLRLLLERGLEVPEVLVVTYTNAATDELRDRVRRRLREALAVAAGGATEDGVLRDLLARAGGPEAARGRLADAIARLDEAAIFTIHGLCQRVLQEHAFESGALYDAELVTDAHRLRLEVAQDFWRRRLYRAPPEEVGWALGGWGDPGGLLAALGPLGGPHPPRLLPVVDADAARAGVAALGGLYRKAAAAWAAGRPAVLDLLASPGLNARSYSAQRVATLAAELDRHLSEPGPPAKLPKDWEVLTPARLERGTRKGHATPAHPFFAAWAAYGKAHGPALQDWAIALLGEAAGYLREELARRKAARGVLFFDDLLAQLDGALAGPGGEALAAALALRYPAALVDEFQDTDPSQYRILRRVYLGRPGTALVLVGDPKQAIYAFRGADVFTYLAARADTDPGAGRFTLPVNRRSAARLVDAVNALFGRVPTPFIIDGVPFEAAAAAGQADQEPLQIDGTEAVPMVLWPLLRADLGVEDGGEGIPTEGAKARVAAACARAIVALLEGGAGGTATLGGRPVQARDLAVLVRNRQEAARVQAALRAAGVASAFLSRESVFASETADELAWLLEAVAEPTDARVRAALATTLLGHTASGLEGLARDDAAWQTVLERFQGWGERWRERGPLPMVQRVVAEAGVAARLLALPDGERRLTDLLQLAELLQVEAAGRAGVEPLLGWLAGQRATAGGEDEAAQLRLESDEDVVSVVTVHKSKGLEYPIVFLPFPWATRSARGPAAFHDPASGEACLDLATPPRPEHAGLAARETLAEEVRLLYVALTRARHRVYLSWGAVKGAERSALAHLLHGGAEGAPGSLADEELGATLEGLAADAPGCIAVEPLPPAGGARWRGTDGAAALAARPFAGRVNRGWRVTSYSGLVTGLEPERPDYDPGPTPGPGPAPVRRDLFGFPRGTRAGAFLHRLLEVLDFPAARGPALERTVGRELERAGLEPAWGPVLVRGVEDVLDTPLADDGLRLRRIERGARRDELEFEYPLARLTPAALEGVLGRPAGLPAPGERLTFSPLAGVMRGFIDLVLEWQGRFYLVDYKSNHLGDRVEDYRPEALAAAIGQHRYDLQYLIYTVALDRYLRHRLPDYRYERHFGGVYYLFLRGMRPEHGPRFGVYHHRPDAGLVRDLDRLFRGD
jgi:exodeoxyribonuclease V beta subunit